MILERRVLIFSTPLLLIACGEGPQPRLPQPAAASASPGSSAASAPLFDAEEPAEEPRSQTQEPVTRAICRPGTGDCDGDLRNGCEQDLTTSPLHCGVCGKRCSGGCMAGFCDEEPLPQDDDP